MPSFIAVITASLMTQDMKITPGVTTAIAFVESTGITDMMFDTYHL